MVAYFNCALSFISLLMNFKTVFGHLETGQNAIFGTQNDRAKRQAGYVYDKPSISFNLPSRNPIISTSTQASPPVDRTSMQMYYAYPAPAERNTVNIGFNSAAATVSSSPASVATTGYNYAAQNTQGGIIENTATGTGGTNGYNYDVQNTQKSSVGNIQTEDISGSSGYNYGEKTTVLQNTGAQNTEQQNSQAGSGGNIVTGTTSGASGYNYGIQNSGLQTSNNAGSSGYSTQTTIQNSNSGTSSNVGSTGYSTQSTVLNSETGISIGGVSTNAPKYLPPSNPAVPVTTTIVNTPAPTVSVSAPSDTYIPPSRSLQNTPTSTVTKTESNIVPSVNVGVQTSSNVASAPNVGYITPNTVPNVSNVLINQARQTTVTSVGQPQPIPTTNYLPPIMRSSQGTVSTPASSYLPPVF